MKLVKKNDDKRRKNTTSLCYYGFILDITIRYGT